MADTAIGLFAVHGFEDTTIEAIADAVDVSRRTFHRYFPCKEDVLFADAADRLALFRAALDERPLDEPVLTSVRAAVRALAAELSARPETELTRLQLIESTPALRAQHLRYQEELAAAVADFSARRAEPGTDPAWPALLGACTVAVLSAMRRHWTAGDAEGTLADVLDHGFDLLTGLAEATENGTP